MPTSASVVVSTCMITGSPFLSAQWLAVPMYGFVRQSPPSLKMKFAVQPYGATMQPFALTPGAWKPGHAVLSYSSATCTPSGPAAWIRCLSAVGQP